MKPALSIIVCTWNRADTLADCLVALSEQTLSPRLFEVIVVDNNSTDHTSTVVAESVANSNLGLRCVLEKRQGLSVARNRGINESKAQLLVFLDDDSLPHRDYLERLLEAVNDTGADMVAGRVISVLPENIQSDIPRAFIEHMNISGLDLGPIRRQMTPGEFAVGANMAVRKSLVDRIGGFRECLGSVGERKITGDDTEFCQRARCEGARLFWVPEAAVDHCVEAKRYTKKAMRSSAFYYGVGRIIRRYQGSIPFAARLRVALGSSMGLLLLATVYVFSVWSPEHRFRKELAIYRSVGRVAASLAKVNGS